MSSPSSLERQVMITSSSKNEEEEEEERHRQYAMQLASASVLPMVLKAAIELGLLQILGKAGPGKFLSSSEIASHLHSNNPEAHVVLDSILSLLASHSIVTCIQQQENNNRLYGLAPVSKYFIPNQDGVSFAPTFEIIQDQVMVNMWYHLKDAVMEGGLPFNRAHGMNTFDYVGKDERFRELFIAFTRDFNLMFMNRIFETYQGFEGLNSIVDVGGGDGSILNMIVSKYPAIKGINFDLPTVIENNSSSSYPGIEHVSGDMFLSIPKGETIFMKWMLHTWDDEHCLKILKNCYNSLPHNGKVIVVDMVVPETPETSIAVKSELQLHLILMNMNPGPGGKERTKREFESLAKAAGFSSIKVAARTYNYSLVEFYKTM